jgi:hypothetical protein
MNEDADYFYGKNVILVAHSSSHRYYSRAFPYAQERDRATWPYSTMLPKQRATGSIPVARSNPLFPYLRRPSAWKAGGRRFTDGPSRPHRARADSLSGRHLLVLITPPAARFGHLPETMPSI